MGRRTQQAEFATGAEGGTPDRVRVHFRVARIRALASALLALPGLALPAPGQATPPGKQQPAQIPGNPQDPEAEERKVLDEVIMTVDNKVVLLSEVEDSYNAKVQARLNANETLDARERRRIYLQVRQEFLSAAVRAQSAWSIKGLTPDKVQQIVDQEFERRQNDRIKKFGSLNNMQQQMGLLSKSEFIRERREREQILQDLAAQDLRLRFKDRLALMITPKALRAHYERRLPAMKTTASVDLGIVVFENTDGIDAALAQAAAAARRWDNSFLTAAQIAAEFHGLALDPKAYRNLTAERAARLQPFIREFIATAQTNSISRPIQHGGSVYLLKVLNLTPGNDFRWDDPEVQRLLRRELERKEYERILTRMDRERQKTLKIWPPPDRGRSR